MQKPKAGEIDREWFIDRLAGRKISQRKLAKHLGLDPAAVTLILQNRRKITNQEAHEIASLLGVSVSEILRRAGVPTGDDVRRVPVSGVIDANSNVSFLPEKTHDFITCPADVPSTGFALQLRSPNDARDRWLFIVSGEQLPPEDNLDKFVVAVTHDGRTILAMLKRGYKSGTYNLVLTYNGVSSDNEAVTWVSPVTWIKPQ